MGAWSWIASAAAAPPAPAPIPAAAPSVPVAAPVAPVAPEDPVLVYKRDAVKRALDFTRAGKSDDAAAVVMEVRTRFGANDTFPDELLGTVQILEKNYVAAEASFRAMLAKDPKSRVGLFNLAEAIFLQARYEEAERCFADLDAAQRESDPAIADLCRYKRVICRLALGEIGPAEFLLPFSDHPSPAARYAHAATLFARGDLAGANVVIADALAAFSPEVENLYVDSLIELRWGSRDAKGVFAFRPMFK